MRIIPDGSHIALVKGSYTNPLGYMADLKNKKVGYSFSGERMEFGEGVEVRFRGLPELTKLDLRVIERMAGVRFYVDSELLRRLK